MSERDFFSDTVTESEEDEFLRDALDDDISEPADDSEAGNDEDLTDDSESDEEEDLEDSEDEEDDLDDEDQVDGEEEDDLPTPIADFDGWLNTLEDDERSVVESLVEQAALSETIQQNAVSLVGQLRQQLQNYALANRTLEQMLKINQLAIEDPHKFVDFRQRLNQAQALRAQQQNSPEAQRLAQIQHELRTWMTTSAEREQREGLLSHVRAGKPLTMDDGSKIAFKQLSPIEDQLLSSARSPQEFDAAIYKIQATRQQSTERARETLREKRVARGADRAGVRASGGHGGTKSNYGNYDPDNFDQYMDDVISGAARG